MEGIKGTMNQVLSLLSPNRSISKSAMRILIAGQLVTLLLLWEFATPPVIPKVSDVVDAFRDLWSQGFAEQIFISLSLYFQALLLATVFSLLLAYSSAIVFFRPAASLFSWLRFLGMTGLPFLAAYFIHGVHEIKLLLLSFSISVFIVTGMLDALASIPKEKYDLARTMRMNEWQVSWEVQILGRADIAFDVIRQNSAIGWMMLGAVEGLFKSEGGIGAVLDVQNHTFHLASIAAVCVTVLVCGAAQDYLLGVLKNICCPYAELILERR
jgi:NitT/TauT family transport system permease protein